MSPAVLIGIALVVAVLLIGYVYESARADREQAKRERLEEHLEIERMA